MGTRGAFGFVIKGEEKIGYNQYDSYPEGRGVDVLKFLRAADLEVVRNLAERLEVIDDNTPPTPEQVKALAPWTNLSVSGQSTDDWYCLTHRSHGDLGEILACGYIDDGRWFPLDSLFCEWAYVVDLDAGVLEVYKGFQEARPTMGRWAGRPTDEDDQEAYESQVAYLKKHGREPRPFESPKYKAVELIATYPLDDLPTDEDFVAKCDPPEEDEAA